MLLSLQCLRKGWGIRFPAKDWTFQLMPRWIFGGMCPSPSPFNSSTSGRSETGSRWCLFKGVLQIVLKRSQLLKPDQRSTSRVQIKGQNRLFRLIGSRERGRDSWELALPLRFSGYNECLIWVEGLYKEKVNVRLNQAYGKDTMNKEWHVLSAIWGLEFNGVTQFIVGSRCDQSWVMLGQKR